MNYSHIENLVLKAKDGDATSKEALAFEFAPLIQSLSRKSFINSYEASDIKNTVNHLIRVSVRRSSAEGAWGVGAVSRKTNILRKLKKALNVPCKKSYLN